MDKLDSDWFQDKDNILEARKELQTVAKKGGNEAVRAGVKFLCACLRWSTTAHLEAFKGVLEDKLIKWKGHDKDVCEVLDQFQLIKEKPEDEDTWYNRRVADAVQELLERTKACHKTIGPAVVKLLVSALNKGTETQLHVADGITSADDIEKVLEKITDKEMKTVLDAMFGWIKAETFDPESSVASSVISGLGWHLPDARSTENVETIAEIINYCSEKELFQEEEPDEPNVYGGIIKSMMTSFLATHMMNPTYQRLVTPAFIRLLGNEEVSEEMDLPMFLSVFLLQPDVLAQHAEPLLDAFIKTGVDDILDTLPSVYKGNPELFKRRLPEIFEKMDGVRPEERSAYYDLFHKISKTEPETIMPYLEKIEEGLGNFCTVFGALQTMVELCKYDTTPFLDKIDSLEKVCKSQPMAFSLVYEVLSIIGLYNEEYAERVMVLLTEKLTTGDVMHQGAALMFIKTVGGQYKSVLEKRRSIIEDLVNNTSTQMGDPRIAQALLDFLDDKSLKTLGQEIQEQKEKVGKLDDRITKTEETVGGLQEDVSDQRQQLGEVQEDVREQGEKLTELAYVVDDTVDKVEEIDHKTLSAAPSWSRDVSRLMNEEGDYDWRFLAVRLRYGPEDIRAWATNADPTMAMLNEWYNTHRSSEATYAVLKSLQEMGRTDAAEIIETAMEKAGAAVPKSAADEPTNLPPVFISYQWDIQDKVKLIKEHLQMAGYDSWMDIGQMGGGDQLYAKIDKGMRGAKVVLAMVTPKYAESENCNREVNLANLLNKPIIPLLVENTPWPPPGSMSMIFSELLYIMFHGATFSSGKFWPDASFYELLGQLAYHAAPDQNLITDEYRNWTPTVEQRTEKESTSSSPSKTDTKSAETVEEKKTEPVVNPEVFLSYQWGHQPQVKALYSQLTSQGFTCWMDIQQMGGGDALYGKIDKGIRNAKVILSCVTPKYAMSANCRREVSLADALKKPIVPLLMEDMSWPPEGPMSLAFTELLYIDCRDERTQSDWQGPKFEELMQQVSSYVTPMPKQNTPE